MGSVSARGAIHPPTGHPILLLDRGFAAVELFRALDTLGWDGVIRTKGSVWVQSDGRWRPQYGDALERPVLKDLPAVRYGRRYKKDAYPCRVIVYAEPGYPDSWDLVVSAGLKNWEPRRLVAAYGQRFTPQSALKIRRMISMKDFLWMRDTERSGTVGSDAPGLCVGVLWVECRRVGDGNRGQSPRVAR